MRAIRTPRGRHPRLTTGAALMALGGLAFVGYAAVFLVLNFTGTFLELGIGPDQVDKGKAEVAAFSPQLYHYISHVHIALSAFIATTGIAITALSWYGVRRRWALNAAVSIVVVGLAIALPAHYPWGLATPWHLGPVYAAVVLFLAGAVVAYGGMRSGEAAARRT